MNIKIASYPGRGSPTNPYVDLFYDALVPHGIELVGELKMDIDWLTENCDKLDGIHFHWPETIWKYHISRKPNQIRRFFSTKVPGAWRLIKYTDRLKVHLWQKKLICLANKIEGFLHFRKFLKICKHDGIRIIWTLHNIESHEGDDLIDKLGYHYLAKATNLIIFHSEISKNEYLARHHLNGQSVIMPHGNYDGVYPPARAKNIVLKELGLRNDLPIVSCLGILRNYKGLDIATEAISLLDGEVQFLCAGFPYPGFDLVSLHAKIAILPNAVLISRFLSDQEFADYVSISDLLFMPYSKITGSGALMAALTLGRGVIASDLPYFRDVLENSPNAGILVPAGNSIAFAENIRKFLKIPAKKRIQAARYLAERYEWGKVVTPVVEVIKSWGLFKTIKC